MKSEAPRSKRNGSSFPPKKKKKNFPRTFSALCFLVLGFLAFRKGRDFIYSILLLFFFFRGKKFLSCSINGIQDFAEKEILQFFLLAPLRVSHK